MMYQSGLQVEDSWVSTLDQSRSLGPRLPSPGSGLGFGLELG